MVSTERLWAGLFFDGAIALIVLGVLLGAGFQLTVTMPVALVLGVFLIRNLGVALLPQADDRLPDSNSASFVAGFAALSMAMMAIVMTLPLSAFEALLVCVPASAIAIGWRARRRHLMSAVPNAWFEPVVVLVLGATLAWLCRLQIAAYLSLLQSNQFHPWDDFFVHGAQLAQFGDPLAVNHGDILEAGRPLAFYHYGMFMLPAALLALPHALPGLAIATSALVVSGLLIAILGCFALAYELGGALAALVAVAAVMLLPDAAALWPGSGSFGFHWLMMVAPGSGYAIGVSAVALVYLIRWQQMRRWSDAWFCALLITSVALLRVQIFAVMAPACIVTAVYTRFSNRSRQITVCLVGLMLLLAIGTIFVAPFQHWFETRTRFTEFISYQYHVLPNALVRPYAALARFTSPVTASWLGLVSLPVLILGPWILVVPLGIIYLGGRKLLCRHDLIPLMLLVVYLCSVLFAPTPSNGDYTEFKQRPFVLIYVMLLLWPIARLAGNVSFSSKLNSGRAFACAAVAIFCVIGLVTLLLQGNDPQANPASWTKTHIDSRQPDGLGDAAAYIRAHARPGDVMASLGGCANYSVALASMTDVPQYFAQGGVQWSRRERGATEVDPHVAVMRAIQASDSAAALATTLTSAGINWLVVITPSPGCDTDGPKIDSPVFQSRQVAVFAVPHRS